MEAILNTSDFERLLKSERAVLYIYVEWSVYAVKGLRMTKEVEQIIEMSGDPKVSFWLADVSDIDSAGSFILGWIQQENEKVRMLPAIATGNGSLVWISNGQAVGFALSASHLGVDGMIARTRELFWG